jgi:hypothetical protein
MIRSLVRTALLITVALTADSHAGTIGYWQLQDGAPASNVSTASSTVNNGSLQGTGVNNPVFDASVPGPVIRNGVGGSVVNGNNSASVVFSGSNGINVPFSSLVEPSTFTIEFFAKTNQAGYPGVVVKPAPNTAPHNTPGQVTWGLGFDPARDPFFRFDTTLVYNGAVGIAPPVSANQWHHLALSYDPANGGFVRLYADYQLLFAGALGGLVYDGVTGLRFGASGSDFSPYIGAVDEIRLSDTVLQPNQFLQAVPEPASVCLMGFALISVWLLRRRSNNS